jgi:hypothetical protein
VALIEALACRASQQLLQLPAVKAHHCLAVNERYGRGHVAESLQIRQRFFIGNVPVIELDVILGKKLFHLATEHSPGLAIDHDLLAHRNPPQGLAVLCSRLH